MRVFSYPEVGVRMGAASPDKALVVPICSIGISDQDRSGLALLLTKSHT
jgi:hypothetical protein